MGIELLGWRERGENIKQTSNIGLKLLADKKAHNFLVNGLSSLYPKIPIISEKDEFHDNNRPT